MANTFEAALGTLPAELLKTSLIIAMLEEREELIEKSQKYEAVVRRHLRVKAPSALQTGRMEPDQSFEEAIVSYGRHSVWHRRDSFESLGGSQIDQIVRPWKTWQLRKQEIESNIEQLALRRLNAQFASDHTDSLFDKA